MLTLDTLQLENSDSTRHLAGKRARSESDSDIDD